MKIFPRIRKRNSGLMLLECLTYIAGLAVVMGLAYAAYYRCVASSNGMRRNANDITKVLQCGEIWREDVRHATGKIIVSKTEKHQTVRIPQKSGEVVYHFENGAIKRSVDGKKWNSFLPNVAVSQIKKEDRKQLTAWRWEVELNARKEAEVRPLFTFQAVPEKQ